jgi:hypothetical protein
MYKKTLLILFATLAIAGAQPPLVPPPEIRQFKVHYICQGSSEARDLLVDANDEDDARQIIQNMIPCVVILKVTEVLLYEDSLQRGARRGMDASLSAPKL